MNDKGILAFDIDGTLTAGNHVIPEEVISHLAQRIQEGWRICLLTGRTLAFAKKTVANFPFSFYLAVQNGADILTMPEEECISRAYLKKDLLLKLDFDLQEDFLIYSGFERGDFCYYRPDHLTTNFEPFIEELEQLADEKWKKVKSWEEVQQDEFPLIKAIGTEKELKTLDDELHRRFSVSTSVIRDPITGVYHLNLITASEATKGGALTRFVQMFGGPVIAAGDDNNDISMLERADVSIVMGSAPSHMLENADIVAPPSREKGIIPALQQAIELLP